jgi:hypothetical protein
VRLPHTSTEPDKPAPAAHRSDQPVQLLQAALELLHREAVAQGPEALLQGRHLGTHLPTLQHDGSEQLGQGGEVRFPHAEASHLGDAQA